MLRFGKQNEPGQFRMPTMSAMPTPDDLQFILSKAQRNWRVAAELSFRVAPGSPTFAIVVQCEMGTGDPTWTLRREEKSGFVVLWSHTSSDVPLIGDLIASEFNADNEKDAETGDDAESKDAEAVDAAAVAASEGTDDEPLDADKLAVESVFRGLCRPETGILTYPAFLYFVDQEFHRFQRGGLGFTVAIFEINYRETEVKANLQPLTLQALQEAALRIVKAKRDIDMLAHFGTFDLAFLLPHTDSDGAAVLAGRVKSVLTATPLIPGMDPERLSTHFGIASMPGDAARPGPLVTAALNAMRSAAQTNVDVVLNRDWTGYYH